MIFQATDLVVCANLYFFIISISETSEYRNFKFDTRMILVHEYYPTNDKLI